MMLTKSYPDVVPIGMVLKYTKAMKVLLNILFFSLFLVSSGEVLAQNDHNHIEGQVVEESEEEEEIPLIGVNVYWAGTTQGTVTDENGNFHLDRSAATNKLVISYVGYQNDTVEVTQNGPVKITLKSSVSLDAVTVESRKRSTEISYLEARKVEKIGEKELMKAACCNLSESFETTPGVDVAFTDAVTGTRQIQMLGLAGPYTQILNENIPDVRGLSANYGLTYIPGPWVEGIQLTKGTGSVLNGFESIAGQINVELRKPQSGDRMYLNAYANEGGRFEGNANLRQKVDDHWSTGLLLHGSNMGLVQDRNNDGFMDNLIGSTLIGLNRWNYHNEEKGREMQIVVKGVRLDHTGGETDAHNSHTDHQAWVLKHFTQRLEGFVKMGKIFTATPWKSLGLQLSGVTHNQKAQYGGITYNGRQNSLYSNLLYRSIIGNTNHIFITGASVQYDNLNESLNDSTMLREEIVPGAFFEYSYKWGEKFSAVAGIRGDYHNIYGAFASPRLHLRYAPTEKLVFRASGGRGQRTASIFAENNGIYATSRQIEVLGDGSNKPYGLMPEVAWNFGGSITKTFTLDYRDGAVSLEFYRTDFQNQIVMDLEDPRKVVFYNLNGKSYSNSAQIQVDYELLKRLDVRLAYRWYDVKTQYSQELLEKPFVSAHRAFANLAYATRNNWKFDFTANWQGSKRVPYTGSNPVEYQVVSRSPDYWLLNTQVTKVWRERFEVYVGVENILNFKQQNPILSSEQPFSEYFDASLVWGPVFGRNTYLGLRYKIF